MSEKIVNGGFESATLANWDNVNGAVGLWSFAVHVNPEDRVVPNKLFYAHEFSGSQDVSVTAEEAGHRFLAIFQAGQNTGDVYDSCHLEVKFEDGAQSQVDADQIYVSVSVTGDEFASGVYRRLEGVYASVNMSTFDVTIDLARLNQVFYSSKGGKAHFLVRETGSDNWHVIYTPETFDKAIRTLSIANPLTAQKRVASSTVTFQGVNVPDTASDHGMLVHVDNVIVISAVDVNNTVGGKVSRFVHSDIVPEGTENIVMTVRRENGDSSNVVDYVSLETLPPAQTVDTGYEVYDYTDINTSNKKRYDVIELPDKTVICLDGVTPVYFVDMDAFVRTLPVDTIVEGVAAEQVFQEWNIVDSRRQRYQGSRYLFSTVNVVQWKRGEIEVFTTTRLFQAELKERGNFLIKRVS